MKRSTNRILTTHAGRLEEPGGMPEVIRKQANAGIDIVGDGELGRVGFGLAYYGKRFTGLGSRPLREGEARWSGHLSGERIEFDEFYKTLNFERFLTDQRVCELLGPEAAALPIDVHPLPNLRAVNVVVHGLLGDGVASSTRPDPQAKGLGEYLRSRVVDVPEELL